MKKRILSLLIAMVLCFSLLPVMKVSAATGTNNTNVITAADNTDDQLDVDLDEDDLDEDDLNIDDLSSLFGEALDTIQEESGWTLNELLQAYRYGIIPDTWFEKDPSKPIRQEQLLVLLAQIRIKILQSGCVTDNPDPLYKDLMKNMSVEKVLNTYYYLISSLKYKNDLGTDGMTAIAYMKDNGIYTGKNGEPALKDTCTMMQACAYAARVVTCVYDKLDAGSKGFLWKATNGGNTVYMLGSIHVGTKQIYPFSKDILEAYKASDSLVLEVNLFDLKGLASLDQLSVYSDGTTLKDHVSAETYQKVISAAEELGMDEASASMFKAWFWYLLMPTINYLSDSDADSDTESDITGITNISGDTTSSLLGIDMNFLIDAYLQDKPVMEIEGYEKQYQVFDSFSDQLQEYLLKTTLDGTDDSSQEDDTESINSMLELWHEGDVDTFLKDYSINEEYSEAGELSDLDKKLYDEFVDKLLTKRNQGMADYIDNLLKSDGSNTYFVVVGSNHYISNYSVLDILKSKGYTITQIK